MTSTPSRDALVVTPAVASGDELGEGIGGRGVMDHRLRADLARGEHLDQEIECRPARHFDAALGNCNRA